jgi:hypothetical protein
LETVRPELIEDPRVRLLIETVVKLDPTSSMAQIELLRQVLDQCGDEATRTFVAQLCNSELPELTEDSIRSQLRVLLDLQARESARRLAPLIEAAERSGDHAELERLLAEKARLRQDSAKF